MSHWNIIRPKAFTNIVTNNNFSDGSTGTNNTLADATDDPLFGATSGKVTFAGTADSVIWVSEEYTITAVSHFAAVYIKLPSGWDGGNVTLAPFLFTSATTQETGTVDGTVTGVWQRAHVLFTPAGGDLTGQLRLSSAANPTNGLIVYIDGFSWGISSVIETYVDGDQPGCFWNGTPYASTSTRIASDRRGGEILDLSDDLYYTVHDRGEVGTGMVEIANQSQRLSQQGGALYNHASVRERQFTLNGSFNTVSGSTVPNFHSRRRALLKALYPRPNTDINDTPLPVLLQYTGGDEVREISAYYAGGLQNGPNGAGVGDPESLRFLVTDPFFYGPGRPAATLATSASATFRMVARRIALPQNITANVWDTLGPPSASGTYTSVLTIAEDATYIYVGGDFLNFDNIANADYIARWHKVDRAWSAMGTGGNGLVADIKVHANGDVYAVGGFTTMGGVTCRTVARWDGAAWNAIGPPSAVTGSCKTIEFGDNGVLYVGGGFTNFDGIAAADGVATWTGSAWAAMGTGTASGMNVLVREGDYIYAGGTFSSMGGVANTDGLAKWNIADGAWESISDAVINGGPDAIVFDAKGNFYIGGNFDTIDSDGQFSRVAYYNGQSFIPLDGGANSQVTSLAIDSDGKLYASGFFTSMGTISELNDRVAVWTGSTWAHVDLNLFGTGTVYKVFISPYSGDIYLGTLSGAVGTGTYAAVNTVSYQGSAENYPIITISRSGGTTAHVTSVRNETTDADIFLNYALADGETLTIQTSPFVGIGVVSSFSGPVTTAILRSSNEGNFYLDPGNDEDAKDNLITAYVNTTGSPTITAYLYYRNTYLSQD